MIEKETGATHNLKLTLNFEVFSSQVEGRMSKYDKSVSISHEEEGTYHRREYEQTPARPASTSKHYSYEPVVTTYTSDPVSNKTSNSNTVAARRGDTSDEDNFEEWTTSKRKINHKTRQVETRVSRQLLVEDGKVLIENERRNYSRNLEGNADVYQM